MHDAAAIVRRIGRVEYAPTLAAMQAFTERRAPHTPDEIWSLEHPPVYTVGLKARHKRLATAADIPVIATDRGGDVTYHGPGQPIVYVLLDLARRGWGIRRLVHALEQAVIDLLSEYAINGERRLGAPGIYVGGRKIAALGLRVRRGATYHGLALNVAMDLAPFAAIEPCGYPGLAVTQLAEFAPGTAVADAQERLTRHVDRVLAYTGQFAYSDDTAPYRRPRQRR